MKKFISILLLILIGFQSNQSVFANQNSNFNNYQQTIFNRAVSKLEPVIEQKGEKYRLKVIKALEKLESKIKRDDQRQVVQALVDYFDQWEEAAMNDIYTETEMNWNIWNLDDCKDYFMDGYKIVPNPYIKNCDDLSNQYKVFKYLLSQNNNKLIENYFNFTTEQRDGKILSKFEIYNELEALFLAPQFQMSISDFEKLLKIFWLDKNFFQNLTKADYGDRNPILDVFIIWKKDKWLANFLFSQGIALDEETKISIGRDIADYRWNKIGYNNLNDEYVAIYEPYSIHWKTSEEKNAERWAELAVSAENKTTQQVVVNNPQQEPEINGAELSDELTQAVSKDFLSFKTYIENSSNINKLKTITSWNYKSSALEQALIRPDSKDSNAIIEYLLLNGVEKNLLYVSDEYLSVNRLEIFIKTGKIPESTLLSTFWLNFNKPDIRNYLLTKLTNKPDIDWMRFSSLWNEYWHMELFKTSSINVDEYLKYFNKTRQDKNILTILWSIGGSINGLLGKNPSVWMNTDLDFKKRAINKMEQLVDSLLLIPEAKSMNNTLARDEYIIVTNYDFIKSMAKQVKYQSNNTSENIQEVNNIVTQAERIKLKILKFFLSKGFNPDEKNWWHLIFDGFIDTDITRLETFGSKTFRDIARENGNTKILELIQN